MLGDFGEQMEDAGAGVPRDHGRGRERRSAASRSIGGGIRVPFDGASEAGAALEAAGQSQQDAVDQLALTLGIGDRGSADRDDSRSCGLCRASASRGEPSAHKRCRAEAGIDLLALRALANQNDRRARERRHASPWQPGVAATTTVMRALAALELRSAGVRLERLARRRRSPLARMLSMSGHSKWATTKHKKAINDSRRAKSFAKLIKNIEVAAKIGGADLSGNPTLVDAIQKAKKTSVPNANIDRAVKRGAGSAGEAVDYTTIMYEGYGPDGVALLIECLTDNKNRAAAEVRTRDDPQRRQRWPTRAASPTTSHRKGVIVDHEDRRSRPKTTSCWRCSMPAPKRSTTAATASRSSPTRPTSSRCARRCRRPESTTSPPTSSSFPNLKVEVDAETARKVFRLIDALEDSDDVQNIYSNSTCRPRCRPSSRRRVGEEPSGARMTACACSASTPG